MEKNRPKPTGNERNFNHNQMFFSHTDTYGAIRFGNDVFVKISGYTKDKLFGAPHNIIRHPDMPKCVFKLFWQTIKSQQPIVAYVKNMAINGDHYWVLAAAYPIEGGYLSIRIKPTSEIFHTVKKVYEQVLQEEQKSGVDRAGELLLKLLNDSGFSNYEEFMTKAFFNELKALDKILQSDSLTSENGSARLSGTDLVISQLKDKSLDAANVFRKIFGVIEGFETSNKFFQEQVGKLLVEFGELSYVSLNLRVLAANFGEKGLAMGVISNRFQGLVSEIETHLNGFSNILNLTSQAMRECIFNIASMKMQTDMVDFFVKESIGKVTNENMSVAAAFADLEKNTLIFSNLCRKSSEQVRSRLDELTTKLSNIQFATNEVKKYINGLEVIEKMGAIEAGRNRSILEAIKGHLERLGQFNQALKKSIRDINRSNNDLVENVDLIVKQIGSVRGSLDEIFSLALTLQVA